MKLRVKDIYKIMAKDKDCQYGGYPVVVYSPTQGLHECISYDEIWFKTKNEGALHILAYLIDESKN